MSFYPSSNQFVLFEMCCHYTAITQMFSCMFIFNIFIFIFVLSERWSQFIKFINKIVSNFEHELSIRTERNKYRQHKNKWNVDGEHGEIMAISWKRRKWEANECSCRSKSFGLATRHTTSCWWRVCCVYVLHDCVKLYFLLLPLFFFPCFGCCAIFILIGDGRACTFHLSFFSSLFLEWLLSNNNWFRLSFANVVYVLFPSKIDIAGAQQLTFINNYVFDFVCMRG